MNEKENEKKLKDALSEFLDDTETLNQDVEEALKKCTTDECRLKAKSGLIKRINEKIITEDNRELLLG